MSDLVSVYSMDLNDRKSFLLGILVTAVGAALIFILSKALFIDQDFVDSIYENGIPRSLAGFSLLLFPYVHQRLAGKRRVRFSYLPDAAVPFEAYTLPWYIVLVYSVLTAFAIAGVSIFLVWLAGMATGFFLTRAVSVLNLSLLFITFYCLGSWIGSRSGQRPYLTSLGFVLSYIALEFVISLVLIIDSLPRAPFGLVIFLSLSLLSALIGALIGRRRQLLNYIRFLLSPFSEKDRHLLVDNLYKEVKQRKNDDATIHSLHAQQDAGKTQQT